MLSSNRVSSGESRQTASAIDEEGQAEFAIAKPMVHTEIIILLAKSRGSIVK